MGSVALEGFGGGGGAFAGLKIVGNPRPSNPKEGTVWCNTDVEITGHHLSATATENPTQGMLWIMISDSSTVEIGTPLGTDYITIMLDSVSQYVGGAWVSVEAQSFQGGVWVDWIQYLYNKGDECTDITGGWYVSRNNNATLTKNADSMVIASNSASSSSSIAMNNGLNIEYDNYTTLNVKISELVTKNSSSNVEVIFRTSANHDNGTEIARKTYVGEISADTVLSLPIPSASVKTLCINVYYGTATIKEIWME